MLNDISKYYPIKSKVHDLNPVIKIICLMLFVSIIFLTKNTLTFLLSFILLIVMIFFSRVPFKIYFKAILNIKWLIIFILITNFMIKVNVTDNLIMVIRLILVVLYTYILTLTTTPTDMISGLQTVFSPLNLLKIPVNRMAFSISLALRFIPNLIAEGNKILKSQASRGIDYNSGIKEKIIALKSLIIPIFILTIKRADYLAEIMEVRLYDINRKVSMSTKKLQFFDIFILCIHIILVLKEVLL